MTDKKHYHLMSGSALQLNPEHVEFYTDCDACKQRFDKLKEEFMKAHSTPESKMFMTLDEYETPSYTKVCQFGKVDNMQNLEKSPLADVPAISGNWVPNYMIMLVECDEDECMNSLN